MGGEPQFVMDEAFASFILGRMPVALTVYGADGTNLYSNPMARNILGLDAEEVGSRTATDARWQTIHEDGSLFHPDHFPISESLRTGLPCQEVVMGILRPDDTYTWVLINSEPIFGEGEERPSMVVAIFLDITEQVNLKKQLYQAQKLDAIGKLSAGVAHDFRNILQAITTSCELVSGAGGKERTERHLGIILKAAARGADLTEQLLAVGRRRSVQPRAFDLGEAVDSSMQILRPVIGDHIDLQVAAADDLWRIHADPGTIAQVIMNLVLNARDAMPEGGTVQIQVRNFTADDSYSRQHVDFTAGDYVLLSVTDDGCGIPPELKEKIFEPYFSTKGEGGHAGLGLAVVYGIVKQQRGSIWVYSEPGQGTSFKIFFPRHLGADEQRSETEAAPLSASRGETILLVDDDSMVREVIAGLLEGNGYSVIACESPLEAMAIARERRIDLLLTDVVMRHMSGGQLAEQMPGLKVVFMSGYTDDATARLSHVRDGGRFLEKPITARELLRAVRTALDE